MNKYIKSSLAIALYILLVILIGHLFGPTTSAKVMTFMAGMGVGAYVSNLLLCPWLDRKLDEYYANKRYRE